MAEIAASTEITRRFDPLWQDAKDDFESLLKDRPLLAHYTSIQVLEQILKNDEIWFSNPLLMNDRDEIKFGIHAGISGAKSNKEIQLAFASDNRFRKFAEALDFYYSEYDRDVFDNYVFCLSYHDPSNTDGLLSMWRGYGSNGDGVAIIFDTKNLLPNPTQPLLILSRVHYGTADERIAWLSSLFSRFATIVAEKEVPDEFVYVCAHVLFERIKLFALFSKHSGFREEQEYRAVYLPERDVSKRLVSMLQFVTGSRGIEPKLKLKLGPSSADPELRVPLEIWIESIILGPTASTNLAFRSMQRMFDQLNKPALVGKLRASTIPLRGR